MVYFSVGGISLYSCSLLRSSCRQKRQLASFVGSHLPCHPLRGSDDEEGESHLTLTCGLHLGKLRSERFFFLEFTILIVQHPLAMVLAVFVVDVILRFTTLVVLQPLAMVLAVFVVGIFLEFTILVVLQPLAMVLVV